MRVNLSNHNTRTSQADTQARAIAQPRYIVHSTVKRCILLLESVGAAAEGYNSLKS